MAVVSLVALALFGVLCVGLRGWLHFRRTGRSPFRSGAGNGKGAVVGYTVLFAVPPVLDLTGALPRVAHGPALAWVGVLCAVTGTALTLWSTLIMGDSWRIGVDPQEHTALVTTGLYRHIRNPIYTAMAIFAVGLALFTPNVAAIAAVIILFVALEFVVRRREEPYLGNVHGPRYLAWAATTGRFLPGIGFLHHT